MKLRDIAYTIGDIIAAHNLLDYVRPGEDRARMIAGATLGALGYGLGPELEAYVKSANMKFATEFSREDLILAAGASAVGGVIGYHVAKDIPESCLPKSTSLQEKDKSSRPAGWVVAVSAGYLGFNVLVNEHTEEFRKRQMWGLGAGSLGYLAGPDALSKLKGLVVPNQSANEGIETYQRGGAILGALGAGGLALYLRGKHNS